MKKYRYLFYRFYCIWKRKKDEKKSAHINAVITITFMFYLNIIDISIIILFFLNDKMKKFSIATPNLKIGVVIFMIFLGLINYYRLAYNGKYLDIIKEFENISTKKDKIDNIFVWIYIILSIGIPVFFVFCLFE